MKIIFVARLKKNESEMFHPYPTYNMSNKVTLQTVLGYNVRQNMASDLKCRWYKKLWKNF
jgi:hypothetical protein